MNQCFLEHSSQQLIQPVSQSVTLKTGWDKAQCNHALFMEANISLQLDSGPGSCAHNVRVDWLRIGLARWADTVAAINYTSWIGRSLGFGCLLKFNTICMLGQWMGCDCLRSTHSMTDCSLTRFALLGLSMFATGTKGSRRMHWQRARPINNRASKGNAVKPPWPCCQLYIPFLYCFCLTVKAFPFFFFLQINKNVCLVTKQTGIVFGWAVCVAFH